MQRDHAAQAISLLLTDAQTTTEFNALSRVARRAWFLWRCPTCRTNNYPNHGTCCGNPRPDDPWED